MELISIKDLAKQTDIHDSMVRIIVKRLKIEVQLNEEKLQCITNEEKQRFLEYVKKDYKRKRKTYNCSPELLAELEKDRAERKELFAKLYGPETEKWFSPNWWPKIEDITPSCFIEV
jgi:hypothetical protein